MNDFLDFATLFSSIHNKNLFGARFKIGDRVYIKSENSTGEITGVNCIDVNEYEYSVRGYPYLYYEDELEFSEVE